MNYPKSNTTEEHRGKIQNSNILNALQAAAIGPKENTEFVLQLFRLVSRRVKEIDEHVTTVATALGQGRLSPSSALELVERIAPGCIDAVYLSMFEGVSPE